MNSNQKHGLCWHPLYECWKSMRKRCLNINHKYYDLYGGRGIKICDRWLDSAENFIKDMKETYKPGLTLERIDNDGNYEPDNCKWANRHEQAINRRTTIFLTINDITKSLREWCEEYNVNHSTILKRIQKGIDPKDALNGIGTKLKGIDLFQETKLNGKDLFK